MSVRDDIRAKVFSAKPRSKVVMFNGVEIEIRQPNLKSILRNMERTDRQNSVVNVLIEYAYVPGTNERVFDDTDFDGIMEMPFDNNFVEVSNAIDELTDLGKKIKEEEKN